MRKLLTMTVVMLVAALIAVPAFAAVQNVRVSGSVDSTYLYRNNFDFGDNDTGDEKVSVFFTQSILDVDADLTDQVSATIALINERVWNETPDSDDASKIAIFQAYVTLREMLYSPLTLIIGRQSFSYGNSLIVDSAGVNNAIPTDSGLSGVVGGDITKQTAKDAFRAILDYNPLTIDVVYSQIADTLPATDLIQSQDITLSGVNANYQLGDKMDSVIEAYFWKKYDKAVSAAGGKSDKTYTIGGRVSTNPLEGLNLQVENAYQKGTKRHSATFNQRRDAWIVQAIANYQVPVMDEYNPTLQYVYTKATGDENEGTDPDVGDYSGWDPMFENQGGGKIYNSIFDLTNFQVHQLGLGFNPMEDLLAKVTVAGVWLEREMTEDVADAFELVQPHGTGTTTFDTTDIDQTETWLGKEVDFELVYDYTEDVQIGGNFGWFFPGSVFRTDDTAAKQAIVHMNVNF